MIYTILSLIVQIQMQVVNLQIHLEQFLRAYIYIYLYEIFFGVAQTRTDHNTIKLLQDVSAR